MRGTGNGQSGVALVLVLWVVALLAVMASALGRSQHTQVAVSGNLAQARQARALLEAGLYFMMAQLEHRGLHPPENPWPVDGRLHPWEFGEHRLWIGAEPEASRLDLNRASADALLRLLRAAGLKEETATALRDAIIDWRDTDHQPLALGAEDDDYRDAGRPAGARDGRLASVDELLLVRGVSRGLLERLRPLVTVLAGQPGIDPRFAPREVLLTLPGLDEAAVEEYLRSRRQAAREGRPLPLPPGSRVRRPREGHVYRLHAELELPGGRILRQSMVVDVRHRSPRGYRVLDRGLHPRHSLPRAGEEEEEGNAT